MRGRMLGLMVALIVGPLCAETVQMVRVHPWLTRGAGEEAIRMVINHNPCPAKYGSESLAPFQCLISPRAT